MPQSLAEFLGVLHEDTPTTAGSQISSLCDQPLTAAQFCEAVLNSQEFREFIVRGLQTGTLPAAIVTRIMDQGWGKPKNTIELQGELVVSKVVREMIDVSEPVVGEKDNPAGKVVH